MKIKRLIWIVLATLIAFSLIAAGPSATKWVYIKVGATKDVQIGNIGMHVTDSYFAGHVKVSLKTKEPVTGPDRLRPVTRMIDVRFKDLNGETVTSITGTWYVYYNLTPYQMRLFNNKKLSIFYFDPWPNEWKKCNTWKVIGVDNRVACRIVYFGLYGLAKTYK